jgi:hypothetical protein
MAQNSTGGSQSEYWHNEANLILAVARRKQT